MTKRQLLLTAALCLAALSAHAQTMTMTGAGLGSITIADWILATGFWVDANSWVDSATWID